MARRVTRGDVWLYPFASPDRRRPVVVLSREEVIDLLRTVMVAPITSTVHGAPSEVLVGFEQGLKGLSAVNLDHVQKVEKARLERWVARLGPATMRLVCRALALAVGREEV